MSSLLFSCHVSHVRQPWVTPSVTCSLTETPSPLHLPPWNMEVQTKDSISPRIVFFTVGRVLVRFSNRLAPGGDLPKVSQEIRITQCQFSNICFFSLGKSNIKIFPGYWFRSHHIGFTNMIISFYSWKWFYFWKYSDKRFPHGQRVQFGSGHVQENTRPATIITQLWNPVWDVGWWRLCLQWSGRGVAEISAVALAQVIQVI